ncbi:uncharacterized protein LOC131843048 isoform X1 [Achroia grisella]|uniref:uncharacterized protein LOC131843048 isoform X1 n=1 Tax=Achroia grisella TaxID=688607 RepID=UPI0027D2826D|nr:uncharacterized protein LOC131843048 isoform X1 [Achroia grisella]
MNDPWDVKSVRQAGQYMSCMKINGVPLLPPVLSKECRKEMQYYKLLAKEVEKRISVLKPYVNDSDSDSSDDRTDAPEIPECEQSYDLPQDEIQAVYDVNLGKIKETPCDKYSEQSIVDTRKSLPIVNEYNNKISDIASSKSPESQSFNSIPEHIIADLSLNISETSKNGLDKVTKTPQKETLMDVPERDYNFPKKQIQKELITDVDTLQDKRIQNIVDFSFSIDKAVLSDPCPNYPLNQDGPSSLSSKSFTGSLNDLHTDSMKDSQKAPNLVRQRSYTLLKPSPQLLAHLEVQSLNTGVEMSCISMSESLSNLSSPSKKRRSWDLESAKVKWSSMAVELNKKNVANLSKVNGLNKSPVNRTINKKVPQASPPRPKSLTQDKPRRNSVATRSLPKSEPVQKGIKRSQSPVRNASANHTPAKEPPAPKSTVQKKENIPPKPLISESEDPATRVKELYEKIQKQQLIQMASLVEKQKREQMLLQQVFEEQNNLLYKQLKTICPKSPIEVKEAWNDKSAVVIDRGPVSLSQLINTKSPEQSVYDSPVSSTLTETNNYISHCDDVLKLSRDITSSIKSQQVQSRTQNGSQSSRPQTDGSRTRTHSPSSRTSRKLIYDTSASSDREYDAILTDRTNDTLADLNVTFPTDCTDDSNSCNGMVINHLCGAELAMVHKSPVPTSVNCRSSDTAMSCVEDTIQNMGRRSKPVKDFQPTPQQITAACYSLHETFVTSTSAERCAVIAGDRTRRRSVAARNTPPVHRHHRQPDIMSQSHSGVFTTRAKRPASGSLMTQSNYETFSGDKCGSAARSRYMPSPRRRPWR